MSNTQTVWVLGAKGFIGRNIARKLEERGGFKLALTGDELSVCEEERLAAFAEAVRPDVIINCAAIKREATTLSTRAKAYEVNALGAANVARVADAVGAYYVLPSTDDVYPTRMTEMCNEFDQPHPDTPYGKSRFAGENLVRDICPDALIVRSSWVYSKTGGTTGGCLAAAAAGEKWEARCDQFASPTSIETYCNVIVSAIERRGRGVLHVVDSGVASRFEFLTKVLEVCGYDPAEVLVPKEDVPTSEQVLIESIRLEIAGVEPKPWQQDVEEYFALVGLAK